MRITTWNINGGDGSGKLDRLKEGGADVLVLQEIGKPEECGPTVAWEGHDPRRGVAVHTAGGFRVAAHRNGHGELRSGYPFRVDGPVALRVLALWSHREPTYVKGIMECLDAWSAFLAEAPSLVIGDFNSSAIWDSKEGAACHSALVKRLEDEFDLVSAYHHHFSEAQGRESRPTLYFRRNAEDPFHIDYCFLPRHWASRITDVRVGNYDDWSAYSDHRPLTVELEL